MVAMSRRSTGRAVVAGDHRVEASLIEEWIRPTPRTIAACGPKLTVWPPTLTLLLPTTVNT